MRLLFCVALPKQNNKVELIPTEAQRSGGIRGLYSPKLAKEMFIENQAARAFIRR
jgi:hypothetical protein